MSLKCSLFGHRYGETEVEREREQDGNELLSTVREVKTCSRCGNRLVVSENKEVKTVERADDVPDETDGIDSVQSADTRREPSAREAQPETATRDDASHSPSGMQSVGEAESGGAFAGPQDRPPAQENDATFINDEGEEVDPEEWSEEGDDTGEGLEGWEPDIEPNTGAEPGSSTPSASTTVPEGEFRCPECGFTTIVKGSSLRAGDFCPDCHAGVLEQYAE